MVAFISTFPCTSTFRYMMFLISGGIDRRVDFNASPDCIMLTMPSENVSVGFDDGQEEEKNVRSLEFYMISGKTEVAKLL